MKRKMFLDTLFSVDKSTTNLCLISHWLKYISVYEGGLEMYVILKKICRLNFHIPSLEYVKSLFIPTYISNEEIV